MARMSEHYQFQSALIIQPGALGDTLLTLTVADYLRRMVRCRSIDLMGHLDYCSILPGRSDIRRVISIDSLSLSCFFQNPKDFDPDTLELRLWHEYDIIITFLNDSNRYFVKNLMRVQPECKVFAVDLHPPKNYQSLIGNYFIDQVGKELRIKFFNDPWRTMRIYLLASGKDRTRGREILKQHGLNTDDTSNPITLIHPGSGGEEKCWTLSRYIDLAKNLMNNQQQVAFLLGPAELERWDKNNITIIKSITYALDTLSLENVLCVLAAAREFIGNDSGIAHLAGMMGVRSHIIFGPTNPAIWRPLGPRVRTSGGNGIWPEKL